MNKLPVVLMLLLGLAAEASGDCRRVVARKAVVVEQAVAVVAMAFVPLFTVGYSAGLPAAPAAYASPAQGSGGDQLVAALNRIEARLAALEGKGGGPVFAAKLPLPFLADANRCGKCHANGAKQGGVDFSAGLKGLTDLQLLGLQMVSRTGKTVAGKDMPPGGTGAITDDEDKLLLEATASEIASRKAVAGK